MKRPRREPEPVTPLKVAECRYEPAMPVPQWVQSDMDDAISWHPPRTSEEVLFEFLYLRHRRVCGNRSCVGSF